MILPGTLLSSLLLQSEVIKVISALYNRSSKLGTCAMPKLVIAIYQQADLCIIGLALGAQLSRPHAKKPTSNPKLTGANARGEQIRYDCLGMILLLL